MTQPTRIYLDNAATSWPKPEPVYEAVERYQREIGAPAGRGVYAEADEVERVLAAARQRTARLLNVPHPDQIVFTANGTDSLNLVLHGLPLESRHVITTVADHNSVLRPLRDLQQTKHVDVTYVDTDDQGYVDPQEIERAIRPTTALIAVVHASNVTGALQPLQSIGRIAVEHDVPLLVDAAQTLGHVPLDVAALHATFVAAPGHKGLLGPLGTGILYLDPEWSSKVHPLRQGGTGSRSEQDVQPDSMPDRFESGNHNVAGLFGLAAGTDWILQQGVERIQAALEAKTGRLLDGLQQIEGIRRFGPGQDRPRVGVVSLQIAGYDPQEVASMLDAAHRIHVRSGLHCAPRMHRRLATLATGGTVRISIGAFNTDEQIDTTLEVLADLAATALTP